MHSAVLTGDYCKNSLLFVASLDLAEESSYFGVLLDAEENAVHLQYPLCGQLFSIKLRQILVARIA